MTKVGAIIAREMEESEERGEKRGRIEGQQSSLITVLSSKGKISKKLEHRIQSQTKNDLLEQWLKIAATAPDVQTFEEQISS